MRAVTTGRIKMQHFPICKPTVTSQEDPQRNSLVLSYEFILILKQTKPFNLALIVTLVRRKEIKQTFLRLYKMF